MLDFLGGLAGGVLSFLGGERRNDQADEQADQNNANSAIQAQLNRDHQSHWLEVQEKFNREMSNSAYQRAVADMKLAGINPMLAYQRGGAPAASIGTASGSMPNFEAAQLTDTITPAVTSAMAGYRLMNEVKQIEAHTGQQQAQTGLLAAQTGLVRDQAANLNAHTAHTLAQLDTPEAQRALMRLQGNREAASAGQLDAARRMTEEDLRQLQTHGRPGLSPGALVSQGDAFLRWLQSLGRNAPGAPTPGALPTAPQGNRGGNPGARMVNPIPGY